MTLAWFFVGFLVGVAAVVGLLTYFDLQQEREA